ncbi:hypothetical protein [Actinacidiphila glaucinigra]|uniref:hypothetical protein n=1 Tax=Actinacidiphila glaucinigra TaxID=235986 RepID=UPI0036EB2E83
MIPPAALDSLYGLAHGDAFGDRWFLASREEREGAIAQRVTPGDAPWYWTDDTAQALVLFGHLAAKGGLWETVAGLGDMDTTCAIAGGVIAARTGIEELPPAWRAALEPLPDWVPEPSGETA